MTEISSDNFGEDDSNEEYNEIEGMFDLFGA